ncbi:MAG: flagellar hook-associated protein 3 [Candidatus Zixiibacteriota bacterium]|nr:MAG: flagellar hook-associated protein 3 [candidate division Zixibacteria bacterium]
MRVTNKMISDQVIANLARSLERFMDKQVQMSTGRRLNRPSDDPIGIQKDLRYRNVLTDITQFKRNISSAGSLLATYDNILGNMKDIIQSANELTIGLSNDTYDAVARNAAANEIESLYTQMIELINSTLEGRHIFSGHLTRDAAVEESVYGVRYLGDAGQTKIEIENNSKIGINLIGSDILFQPLSILGEKADLKIGAVATTLLADLNLGAGVDLTTGAMPGQFTITDNNLGTSVNIDLSLLPADPTLDDVITEINSQLAAAGITNLTVDYGEEGNNLRWLATDTGDISVNTLLENLNGGQGIDLISGHIRLHTADNSIDFEVDLSDAATVGDLINSFNADPNVIAYGLTMAVSADSKGLTISDPLPLEGLMISDTSETSQTAANLGLIGEIDAALIQSSDLNPIADFTASEAAADQTVLKDLGLLGNFNNVKIGEAITPRLTLTDSLSQLDLGNGFELSEIRISQGNSFINLDLSDPSIVTIGDVIDAINNSGLNVLASINAAETGIQVVSTTNTETLMIQEWNEGNTAHDFGIYGSPDILGTMRVLVDAFRNNNGESASQLIGNLTEGINQILNHRASVGAKVIRLEAADRRLTDLDYNFTQLLSEIEDADLTKLISDLAMRENSYQAAMISAAKIIQPSLLNFLK